MATKFTPAQAVADSVGIDGLSFRRHLRSQGIRVGKGKIHRFEGVSSSEALKQLQSYFEEVQGEKYTLAQLKELQKELREDATEESETTEESEDSSTE